jgi:alpha-1,2-mannosyltransferase
VQAGLRSWWTPLAIAAIAVAARLVVVLDGHGFTAIVGYDQGVYYAAADALVHGLRPYGDFLFLHPPGIMLLLSPFAALGSVTSDSTGMDLARCAVVLVGALNVVLVTRIAGRFGQVPAIVGGLFYALWAPAVVMENQARLEPFGNTGVLLALLGLLRRRSQPVSAGVEVLSGVALGAGAGIKIWGVLPLLVVLAWQLLDRGWRSATRVAAGAFAATVAICLPFFALAPRDMFRMVVVDQLHRPPMRITVLSRLYSMSSLDIWTRGTGRSVIILVVVCMVVLTAALLTWRERSARVVVALLAAQAVLLLAAPSYFPSYSEFLVPAGALMSAVAAARVAAWPVAQGRVFRAAGVAALSAVVAIVAVGVTGLRITSHPIFPGPQLSAAARSQRCLLSDTPIALIEMNVLSRDLRDKCNVHVDVTGYTYEGELALGPTDKPIARPNNTAWQKKILGYLQSGSAFVLARGRDTGLSPASKAELSEWRVLARIDGYTVFARPTQPRVSGATSTVR